MSEAARAHPWLDPQRFAVRQFAAAVRRNHLPLHTDRLPDLTWRSRLRDGWAAWLQREDGGAVSPDDIWVCGSDREAIDVALGGLLVGGDVVVVAEPVGAEALLAVLRTGARFLDCGRRDDGGLDAAGLEAASARHTEAVAYVESPGMLSAEDAQAIRAHPWRATVVDLRQALWPRTVPSASAVILALRDPDAPAEPIIHAVVLPQGWGRGVTEWAGEPSLGSAQLEHADAVLQGLLARPAWAQARSDALAQLAAAFLAAAGTWPGVRVVGQHGLRAVVECRGGDAAALAASLPEWAVAVRAHGSHPGRNLLLAELAIQAQMRGETTG